MLDFQYVTFFVADPLASAAFYADLLAVSPVEQLPDFAMLPLRKDVMLGLWSFATAEPKASHVTGASEISFAVASKEAVDLYHADWSSRGLVIAQTPQNVEFGYTFVALDPDGHRLRVLALTPPA
jgi:catechol 2,3-dioxygenase-like lactoylglutathione lyase family enzyme